MPLQMTIKFTAISETVVESGNPMLLEDDKYSTLKEGVYLVLAEGKTVPESAYFDPGYAATWEEPGSGSCFYDINQNEIIVTHFALPSDIVTKEVG